MRVVRVEKDVYFDSVVLMRISSEMAQLPGVSEGVIAPGTAMNKAVLTDRGFQASELATAGANDMIIAVEAASQSAYESALAYAKQNLQEMNRGSEQPATAPSTLRAAVRTQPDANLALISVPGAFAAREAAEALELGLHVMLFSDNVTVEDEVTLKRLAASRGLLMMGPDCGTAIINGTPLGFANRVRRGVIGLVGASGTGIQEVTCLIDAMGGGISQAIGIGGRDMHDSTVGGLMALQGIAALEADPKTDVLVIIAKSPHPDVAEMVIATLIHASKSAVVHFLGLPAQQDRDNVQFASSLLETAELAVSCTQRGRALDAVVQKRWHATVDMSTLARREASRMAPQQQFLCGLYTGGTLAQEALLLLDDVMGPVYSNLQNKPNRQLVDPFQSHGHTVIDMGDDRFTLSKPHPIIDPALRATRVRQEGRDPALGILLLDLVLGYGAHEDPAGITAAAIAEVRVQAEARGGYLPVIASITGTDADIQDRGVQQEKLERAGCIVMPSNLHAVQMALAIAQEAWGGGRI